MKGFVLFVAVVLGILVSNVTFGQQAAIQPTPVVIDGSVSPAPSTPSAPSVTAPTITTAESCCCKQQTLVGMSQQAVRKTVARGRCMAKNLWSKRQHLLHRCRCC